MIEIFDVIQGTPEWLACRAGIPTASEFATVMSEGRADGVMPDAMVDALVKSGCSTAQLAAAVKAAKSRNANPAATRAKYLRTLAGEVITGQPAESFTNVHMDRGRELEAEARNVYAFMSDVDPVQVGFIRNGNKGCSPDSLIGDLGGLEIKTVLPHIQIERLDRGLGLPPEHKAQVQGNIWVCEREWWDFMSYCPGLPPLIVRVNRDEAYIARLAAAVDAFADELARLVQRLRALRDPDVLKRQFAASLAEMPDGAKNLMAG